MDPVEILIQDLRAAGLWEEVKHYKRNEIIFRAGQMNSRVYFIISGSVRVYRVSAGEEQTVRFGYRNNLITALDAFLSNRPTEYSMEALKKTEVWIIGKKPLMRFLESNRKYASLWTQMLESLVLQQMERENDLLTTSPGERYERVLKRSPQLFQEIPSKYIASYLRMTPETLSRLKKS